MLLQPNPAYSRLILIKFVMGIVFIAVLVWWTFTPSSGEREFRRSQEALKHVTSWREEVPPGSSYQEQMEVSCAAQSAHLIRQSHPPSNDINVIDEETRVGTSTYSRHSVRYEQTPSNDSTSDWQRGGYSLATLPCGALARREAAYPFPDYERLIHSAVITRGEKEYIHGAVCRNWKAKVVRGGNQYTGADNREICIGVDDHFPYAMRNGSFTYIFYDWNVPVSIEEPTVVEHPRVPWQQPWPAVRAYDYRLEQRDPEPPTRYMSPYPPPLPQPSVPPPPPPEDDGDPR